MLTIFIAWLSSSLMACGLTAMMYNSFIWGLCSFIIGFLVLIIYLEVGE